MDIGIRQSARCAASRAHKTRRDDRGIWRRSSTSTPWSGRSPSAVEHAQFKSILSEKDTPGALAVEAPPSLRGRIVSGRVHGLRSHPDFRIARRALITSRLAQVITDQKVQGGLRRMLLTQATRLQWLAARRYEALGGAASVPVEGEEDGG